VHDHAATAAEEPEGTPFLAGAGFLLGMVGLILAVTIKLAPAGFMLGVVAIVCSLAGLAQAVVQGHSPRLAVAGFFCSLVTIVFWLLARHDIAVAWGRSSWPDWLF
jgi:hypothetical protein